MRKFFISIFFLFIIGGGLFYLSRETARPDRKIEWGVTFSKIFAQKMGLGWKKAYIEILDDLGIKKLRLVAYWPEIEPEKDDQYSFSDLDWQIAQAKNYDVKVILAIGRKLPRWPECHEPQWTAGMSLAERNEELMETIKKIAEHYKNEQTIFAWQVENEPFLNFGECPAFDQNFLDQEIALVRQIDNRPIVITDSGELSIWVRAAKRADIFGTTMYRWVWHKWLGSYKYPLTPGFFRAKEKITRFFVGQQKPFIVIELQGEPWHNKQIYERAVEEQMASLPLKELKATIDYAKKTGFSEYYLWGAEWWYFLKENGYPEYWEYIKNLAAQQ